VQLPVKKKKRKKETKKALVVEELTKDTKMPACVCQIKARYPTKQTYQATAKNAKKRRKNRCEQHIKPIMQYISGRQKATNKYKMKKKIKITKKSKGN